MLLWIAVMKGTETQIGRKEGKKRKIFTLFFLSKPFLTLFCAFVTAIRRIVDLHK